MANEANATVLLPIEDMAAQPLRFGDGPSLVVSACTSCGRAYLPARPRCLGCGGEQFADAFVAGSGTLYSFSTVHVSSSRPVPYTIGYVDLNPGLRVLADVAGDVTTLRCNMAVTLVEDDRRLAFVPVEAAA